ncbi:hypothetical protein ACE6H2_010746 [Prunus campanulata]
MRASLPPFHSVETKRLWRTYFACDCVDLSFCLDAVKTETKGFKKGEHNLSRLAVSICFFIPK